jgi:hypothetical protein
MEQDILGRAGRRLVAATLVALCLSASVLEAQLRPRTGGRSDGRVPVTIALVDSVPVPGAPAIILRRVGVDPHDVILIARRLASDSVVAAAVATLYSVRSSLGDTARSRITIGVRGAVARNRRGVGEIQQARQLLLRLISSPPREVRGVGVVPAVDAYLRAVSGRFRN